MPVSWPDDLTEKEYSYSKHSPFILNSDLLDYAKNVYVDLQLSASSLLLTECLHENSSVLLEITLCKISVG